MDGLETPRLDAEDRAREYRHALGRFPTGVAFVTARTPEGDAAGLLINSFTSVSLTPPMVLWCLGLSARSRSVFAVAPTFAVSILSEEQRPLITALCRPLEQRFQGVPVRDGLGGAPVLEDAAAVFECSVVTVTRAGDHEVYLGQVEHFERREDSPLAYLAGQYGRVQVAA
ncbi:MAG: flavin reductase family protein [Caulobacter sp.]|nr:flavin reductase family protein [Caulobacter sp.]